jgi:predicted cation transporter
VFPAVVALGVIGIFFVRQIAEDTELSLAAEEEEEKLGEVFVRAGKVYIFVMALIFLGAGFKPLIDTYLLKLPSQILFWVNMVSAILDNATLAAAEIGVKVLTERVAPEIEVMIRVYIERT